MAQTRAPRRLSGKVGRETSTWVLVGAVIIVGMIVDALTPTTYVMTPIYALALLVAAWRQNPRSATVTVVLANGVNCASALIQGTPAEIWLIYSSGLVFLGGLGILVSVQRDHLVRHARDLETAQSFSAAQAALATALSAALAPEEVARVIVTKGVAALDGYAGQVTLLDDDGDTLDVIAAVGYTDALVDRWRHISVTAPVPISEAVRTQQPVFVATDADLRDRYPSILEHAPSTHALAALPLIVDERSIGAFGVSFDAPRTFDEGDRAFMRMLAQTCAQAMERARLFDAERTARQEAQAAQRHLEFLDEASDILASSLDYPMTLHRVAHLAVPILADWCVVYEIAPDQSIRRLAVAHADPATEEMLRTHMERAPLDSSTAGCLVEWIRSGRSLLVPELSQARVAEIFPGNVEYTAFLQGMGPTSLMLVPFVAHGHVVGSLVLVSAQSARCYGPSDLALAENLAHRAALAIDNTRLYHQAREAVQVRDAVLFGVSHDLLNPLGVIKGYAQLAQRRLAEQQAAERELAAVNATVTKMMAMIYGLVDVAHLQIGKPLRLDRHLMDLVALVRQIVEEQQMTTSRRIQVVADVTDIVGCWDAVRLERVIANLIDNAIKYSPNGGEVTVCVGREGDATDAWAILRVCDEGVGIPAVELPRIFEQFHRAGNAKGRFNGSGIGLATVKWIAEQHGGTVDVTSVEGVGTTFTVRLPVTPLEQATTM